MSSAIQQSKALPALTDNSSAARMLAVNELISRFESNLGGVLQYDSFEYECRYQAENFVSGIRQSHTCSYRLTAPDDLGMGEITLSRVTPFRESELQLLEACLADLCLLLPDLINPAAVVPDIG